MSVPQWTVERTRGHGAPSVFEDNSKALIFAASVAEAERPSIVVNPDGTRFAVFRLDEYVELSARPVGASWRLVIDRT